MIRLMEDFHTAEQALRDHVGYTRPDDGAIQDLTEVVWTYNESTDVLKWADSQEDFDSGDEMLSIEMNCAFSTIYPGTDLTMVVTRTGEYSREFAFFANVNRLS